MTRNRENVFTRHPEGSAILELILNKTITQIEAARRLGCTPANVSTYLATRNLRPSLAQRKLKRGPTASELAMGKLEELGEMTLTVDGQTPLELMGAVGWRAIMQGLLMLSERELDPDSYVKVSQALLRMWEYQFKNRVPEVPQKQITLDRETEDRLIQRLGAFCEQCQYRRTFVERTVKQQDKYRLEPSQPSPVG